MQNQTLLDVRYYGEVFHPSRFRGKGWKGSVIRFLNWVRYRLETYVQFRVLMLGMESSGVAAVDKAERAKVAHDFWIDVRKEQLHSALLDPELVTALPGSPSPDQLHLREHRYTTRRGAKSVQEEVGELPRPVPLDHLVARHGSDRREKRYGKGTTIVEDQLSGLDEEAPSSRKD